MFVNDIYYAARQLAHTRVFTAIAVITLALGIGGNTVFFAAVNAMVLRPIRATQTDGLYYRPVLQQADGEPWAADRGSVPAAGSGCSRLHLAPRRGVVVPGAGRGGHPGRAERIDAEVVTSGYLLVLNLVPQAGRLFVREDDIADAGPVAIISDRLWREWFDGDRATDRAAHVAPEWRALYRRRGRAPRLSRHGGSVLWQR